MTALGGTAHQRLATAQASSSTRVAALVLLLMLVLALVVQCWLLVCWLLGACLLLLLAWQNRQLPGALRRRGVAAQQCLAVPSTPRSQDSLRKWTDLDLLEEACPHLWAKGAAHLSHPLIV